MLCNLSCSYSYTSQYSVKNSDLYDYSNKITKKKKKKTHITETVNIHVVSDIFFQFFKNTTMKINKKNHLHNAPSRKNRLPETTIDFRVLSFFPFMFVWIFRYVHRTSSLLNFKYYKMNNFHRIEK